MPGFDRRGPMGDGPMTGGGFGHCGSGKRLRFDGPGVGQGGTPRGGGAGRCWGGGRGRWYQEHERWEDESDTAGVENFVQKLVHEVEELRQQIANMTRQSTSKDQDK